MPTLADILSALWLLGSKIAAAVKGDPAPPIAETKAPEGMAANERAAKEAAEKRARKAVNAPAAKGIQ